MPETTIGFVPDVGGTWLLARAPGEAGTHAALTGAHLEAADALFLGLADHFVPSAKLPGLVAALENETPATAVERFSSSAALCPGGAAGLDRLLLPGRRRRGDSAEVARDRWGSCRRGRHHRIEVAHLGEKYPRVTPQGTRTELGRNARAGVPGERSLPGRTGLPRRHPCSGCGQGPQPAVAAAQAVESAGARRRAIFCSVGGRELVLWKGRATTPEHPGQEASAAAEFLRVN